MKYFLLGMIFSVNCMAEEMPYFELRIKNHKFNIEKIEVPAGKKFKIKVINEDSTSEEFESNSMIVEKFLGPKRSLTVTLGPLKPGTYEYFGEFHMKTAKGIVIAK
ncbi:MAG: cupredoxin domain-containing protein [Bacteriovoracaceae bacterium]|jgi:plastocyanin|nr:cupredoxin domain-containing protein [Bacteriovoracaceae bacterium]